MFGFSPEENEEARAAFADGMALWDGARFQSAPEALGHFERAIEISPRFADAYISQGRVLLQMKRYPDAVRVFTGLERLDGDRFELYLLRSHAQLEMKKYARALADLDQALFLDPESQAAYRARGNVLFKTGRYGLALADFDRAISRKPVDMVSLFYRGNTHEKLGRKESACRDWRKSCQEGMALICKTVSETC